MFCLLGKKVIYFFVHMLYFCTTYDILFRMGFSLKKYLKDQELLEKNLKRKIEEIGVRESSRICKCDPGWLSRFKNGKKKISPDKQAELFGMLTEKRG